MIPNLNAFSRFEPTSGVKPRFLVGLTKNRSTGFHAIIFAQKRYTILLQVPPPSIRFSGIALSDNLIVIRG